MLRQNTGSYRKADSCGGEGLKLMALKLTWSLPVVPA